MKLKISWRQFPEAVRRHLVERIRDRSISEADLYKLQFWIDQQPDVPEGDWFKDFGTFKIAGQGDLIKTFLTPGQVPYGIEVRETDTDFDD